MEAQAETSFSAGSGSAVLATIEATGTVKSAFHLILAASPILVAGPLHCQMLQLLRLAACQSAPLPIRGFMPPTGSFLEANLVAADGEWTLTSCLKSDAALRRTLRSVHTIKAWCFTALPGPALQICNHFQTVPGSPATRYVITTTGRCGGFCMLCSPSLTLGLCAVLCSGTSAAQANPLLRMAICCDAFQCQRCLPAQAPNRQRHRSASVLGIKCASTDLHHSCCYINVCKWHIAAADATCIAAYLLTQHVLAGVTVCHNP